ncbi:MAG: hypothetical protein ACYC5K_10560, partial [Saccharofermentanales bacterium]
MLKRLIGILAALLIIPACGAGAAARTIEDIPYYSYTYDFAQGAVLEAPPAYIPDGTIYLRDDLGKKLLEPGDFFITDKGSFVVADSGNNRIIECDGDGMFIREISSFYNTQNYGNDAFNAPQGVYVSDRGELLVADTGNHRVLLFDEEWDFRSSYIYPATDLIDSSIDYLPIKVACDSQDRIFILAKNINQGIIEINRSGDFIGFLGAAKAKVNASDLFWRLISTKAQKQRMTLFVPSEYNNLFMDEEDFIYCTTSAVSEGDLQAAAMSRSTDDRYAPIRRINPSGTDVLKRAGAFTPLGDLRSKSFLVDVTVRDNGIYSVLDNAMGRVFTYDINGNLLYIFGQKGLREGTVKDPVAIGNIGDTLYVLDKLGSILRYRPTAYGDLIHQAVRAQNRGEYSEAYRMWVKTLEYNHNYELAYVEIGKAQLRLGEYANAMDNFKTGSNRGWYSEAKKLYMNEFL